MYLFILKFSRGTFTHIENSEEALYQLGTYYQHSSFHGQQSVPVFTVPYFDGWGLGRSHCTHLPKANEIICYRTANTTNTTN